MPTPRRRARPSPRSSASTIAELRGKSGQEILDAKTAAGPIVDGWFLPADTYTLFREGKEAPVPFLTGWNRNEGATFPHAASLAAHKKSVEDRFGKDAERASALYPATDDVTARQASKNVFRDATFAWGTWTSARLHAKNGQPTYLYFFDHAQPLGAEQTYEEVDTPDKLGTFHSSEYPYIFGTLDVLSRDWTAADRALSVQLQAYWTNFAKSGDPNGNGLPTWPKGRRRRRRDHAARRSHGARRDPPSRDPALLRRMDAARAVTDAQPRSRP